MAERSASEGGRATPAGPTGGSIGPAGGPAAPPRVAPLAVLYTLSRVGVFVALLALLWLARVPALPALLFAVLLSLPVSYVLLRPLRDRLTEALVARGAARRAAKEQLRARLSGSDG